MSTKTITLESLASELFADITRADMSLFFRKTVLTPLISNSSFQRKFHGAYSHMEVSTVTLSFMTLARMFDEPTGRFSVTLHELVDQADKAHASNPDTKTSAKQFLKEIKTYRKKLARQRSNVFAHKNYVSQPTQVRWKDLEEGRDLAKRILGWYGGIVGHSYSYHVPGFQEDCRRFADAQIEAAQEQEPEI